MAQNNSRFKRTNIYKPNSNHGPAILYQNNSPITIKDPKGNVLDNLSGGIRGAEGTKHPINPSKYPTGSTWEAEGNVHKLPDNPGDRAEYPIYSGLANNSKNPGNTAPGSGEVYTGNIKPGVGVGIGGGALGMVGAFAGPGNVPLPDGATGGGISGVGAYPYYLSNGYPDFPESKYDPITSAPYNKTDAQKFAGSFGDFNRLEVGKNFRTSQELALSTLDTELQGLKSFLPETTGIYRNTINDDNVQNQDLRTNQVNNLLPDARDTLERQRQRYESYAAGKLPDSVMDNALNLSIGSRGADQAIASGFGSRSQQAAKTTDLMSVDQRFNLAQYGESGIGSNLGTRADLFMAPLEYSSAAQQIKLNPEVGAGRLSQSVFGALNSSTLLSPGQAFQSEIQQEQFVTSQEQGTRTFNAGNTLQNDQFNSQGIWQSRQGQFNYDVSYLASVQGANQSNLNFAAALMLQAMQAQAGAAGVASGQSADQITSGGDALGSLAGILGTLNQNSNQTNPANQGGGGTISSGNAAGGTVSAPQSQQSAPQNVPGPSESVGETQVDSSPSNNGNYDLAEALSKPAQTQLNPSQQGNPYQKAVSIEPSSPGGLRFAADTPTPSGYVQSGPTQNGSYPVAPVSQYKDEAARFASFSGMPPQNVSVENLAVADRTVTEAGGMSYIPVQGFRPMALIGGGRQVYASPQAMNSTNAQVGQESMATMGVELASLGIADPQIHGSLSQVIKAADGPPEERQALIDEALASNTPAGQRFAYGMMKVNELGKHLSEAQKSNMLGALSKDFVEAKTGKNTMELNVPGTEGALLPPLKVKEILDLQSKGANSKALAKNWDQLSTFGVIAGRTKDPKGVYNISAQAGLTGYGHQGAAVEVDAKKLAQVSKAAPELGVGARTFSDPNRIPQGYTTIGKTEDGQSIAAPAMLARTSPLTKAASYAGAYKKTALIALGNHKAQSMWSPVDTQGTIKGAAGGSAIVSGLDTMIQANPTLAGSMLAHAYFNNTLGG